MSFVLTKAHNFLDLDLSAVSAVSASRVSGANGRENASNDWFKIMLASPRQLTPWIPTLIMTVLIVWLSTISKPVFHANYTSFLDTLPLPEVIHRFMAGHYKIGHPLCYSLLAAITSVALRGRYLLVILLSFSLGVLLEAVQYLLPTRAGSFVDLGYNLSGVLVGAGVVWVLKTFISRRGAETAEKP